MRKELREIRTRLKATREAPERAAPAVAKAVAQVAEALAPDSARAVARLADVLKRHPAAARPKGGGSAYGST